MHMHATAILSIGNYKDLLLFKMIHDSFNVISKAALNCSQTDFLISSMIYIRIATYM